MGIHFGASISDILVDHEQPLVLLFLHSMDVHSRASISDIPDDHQSLQKEIGRSLAVAKRGTNLGLPGGSVWGGGGVRGGNASFGNNHAKSI